MNKQNENITRVVTKASLGEPEELLSHIMPIVEEYAESHLMARELQGVDIDNAALILAGTSLVPLAAKKIYRARTISFVLFRRLCTFLYSTRDGLLHS